MEGSIGTTLKEARTAKGLELSDIAEITHVRKDYLKALEEGRYNDLPEDIYSRNFLRLYAQALGLEDTKLLDQYTRERRSALGITPDEVIKPEVIQTSTPSRRNPAGWILTLLLLTALAGLFYFAYSRNLLTNLFRPAATPIMTEPTLPETTEVLDETTEPLAETVSPSTTLENESETLATSETEESATTAEEALAEADANSNDEATPSTLENTALSETESNEALSENTNTNNEVTEETENAPSTSDDTETNDVTISEDNTSEVTNSNTASSSQDTQATSTLSETTKVNFTLITDPPGADASLDNYPFATRTPVFNAPVSARESRVLRIDLDGYEPYTELVDILDDTSLSITLKPIGTNEANITPSLLSDNATTPIDSTSTARPITEQGEIALTIEAETWLEVYQSTERGEGEQLYYGTAQSGETLSYELPVYVHVGNAAGVRINENGREVGLMGSSGEVTGRSFGQALPDTSTPDVQSAETTDDTNLTQPATQGNE